MHMNATMSPPSYTYVMPQRSSTDVTFMETLLHLNQQQLAYGQGVFPYTSSSSHEDLLAAHLAPLISLASQVPSKTTAMESWPSMLATPAPTPFDDETIVKALSLITSAPSLLSSLDNGSVPNVLSHQFQMLMVLSELQRQQQQQRRIVEVSGVLQRQREELCRASTGLPPRATSTQVVHHRDTPPVLERQSPEKPSAPKKRRHCGENPSAKRSRASAASPATEFKAEKGIESIIEGMVRPSLSPGGSTILQQLIEDDSPDEDLEKQMTTSDAVGSDSPHRHHPNYLPKRDPEAALLEDYATVYMLNGLGGLCANQLEKSLEEALSDMPSDSSSPSSNENLPSGCSTHSAYASPTWSRASSISDSNDNVNIL